MEVYVGRAPCQQLSVTSVQLATREAANIDLSAAHATELYAAGCKFELGTNQLFFSTLACAESITYIPTRGLNHFRWTTIVM